MSTSVNLYAISFQNKENSIFYSVINFLNEIEGMLNTVDGPHRLVRDIDGKVMRCFSYYYSNNRQSVVIPFGKLKQRNKPYWINAEKNILEEISAELFDINSLAYDSASDIMFFTTNREGPTFQNVKDYLNTFIPPNSGIEIEISPLLINAGIEKIRNAQLVRSVTINLDLGKSLNNFYNQQIENNQPSTLTQALNSIATCAQDGESKALSLEIGLGHGKENATLELESMLQLLEQINIQGDFVKEIVVTYKNGVKDRVDKAKLKNSSIELSYKFNIAGNQIAPEFLLNNIADVVDAKRMLFRPALRDHFSNRVEFHVDNFQIIEVWDPNP